jgi:hypothetical protein
MTASRISLACFLVVVGGACGNSASQSVPDRDGARTAVPEGGTIPETAVSEVLPKDPDAPSCGACVDRKIAWSYTGGLAPSYSTYMLTPCAAYQVDVVRTGEAPPNTPPRTCSDTIPRCWADAVTRALADADVVAALAAANETDSMQDDKVYGGDPRGADGAVIVVEIEKRRLVVGWGDCSTDPNPNCVPRGLRHFVDLLLAIGQEKEKTMPCKLEE